MRCILVNVYKYTVEYVLCTLYIVDITAMHAYNIISKYTCIYYIDYTSTHACVYLPGLKMVADV